METCHQHIEGHSNISCGICEGSVIRVETLIINFPYIDKIGQLKALLQDLQVKNIVSQIEKKRQD